ncbi:olfactory receptor 5A2-like [Hyperolius riggenbachi]|uniref:olfactory receptor 5A2-like n=1 Tax=Hyperolius riggenbachi TaxID=752182 RepID=UPI0035A3B15D
MHLENCTAITEILLVGLKPFQSFRIPMFVLCLACYLVICCENLLIMYIIHSSVNLKAPMFFIIQSMSLWEVLYVTNVVPKLLNDIISERPTFTVTGCIVQLQVFGIAGDTTSFHYVVMSYDRYLAVCHPLHYSSLVSNRVYLRVIIALGTFSVICSGVLAILEGQLQFCSQSTIDHFYCDFAPFLDLSSSDTTYIRLLSSVMVVFIMWSIALSVLVPYIFIIHAVLKISSASGRKKTFSTCSSHLIAFSLLFCIVLTVYSLPASVVTSQVGKTFTFAYFFWSPLVNPIIYCFRSREFRVVVLSKVKKVDRTF